MVPLIEKLRKDENIDLTVLIMTHEEARIAQGLGIDFELLESYTDIPRTRDFDTGWGLAPLIDAITVKQPDLFIAIEVNYILRNAVRYCKQEGIPNIILQHGTPNLYSRHAFVPFEGDCFAAWGEFSKDFLVKNHVDPSRIVITGGIPFDKAPEANKDYVAKQIGIDAQKKWIVLTTQPVGPGNRPTLDETIRSIIELVSCSQKYSDIEFIIQIHPHQNIDIIRKIADVVPNHKAVITQYKNTEELIASSDGMITYFSTTAIDAVLLQKPLMLINLTDGEQFYPFAELGVAYSVSKVDEIEHAFDKLVLGEVQCQQNWNKAVEIMNYKNDGRALERVLSLCYEKLNISYKEESYI